MADHQAHAPFQALFQRPRWAAQPATAGGSADAPGSRPLWAAAAAAAAQPSAAPALVQRQRLLVAGHAPLASLTSSLQLQQHAATPKLTDMSGTWIKDKEHSTSMDAALRLMQLGGLVRQAIKLVRGVRIEQDDSAFTLTVFSIFAWFKVRETYQLSGETAHYKRRDLRRGKHNGHLERVGPNLRLHLDWADPLGGNGTDDFKLAGPDELHINSTINVHGRQATYLTVYKRKHQHHHQGHDQHEQQQHGKQQQQAPAAKPPPKH